MIEIDFAKNSLSYSNEDAIVINDINQGRMFGGTVLKIAPHDALKFATAASILDEWCAVLGDDASLEDYEAVRYVADLLRRAKLQPETAHDMTAKSEKTP